LISSSDAISNFFRVESTAITVPYAAIRDPIRENRGFADLRGEPDKAQYIAEGNAFSALQQLLFRIAQAGSPIFSLGCDIGAHVEFARARQYRQVSGGYIQVACRDYVHAKREAYAAFANAVVAAVKPRAGRDYWEVEFVGQMVNFQFAGEPNGVYPSLTIWFFAAARTPVAAVQSRERLIEAIDEATILPGALDSFGSVAC